METRANYVLIGLFTLAVIVSGFVFIYWMQRAGSGSDRTTYSIRFDNGVSGLRPGSAVNFNGLRVGEVAALRLSQQRPDQVFATVKVDKATPISGDTKIGLEYQGLTGIAAIALKGGGGTAKRIAGNDAQPPLLIADPALSQDVVASAREVLQNVNSVLTENSAALKSAISGLNSFTETLTRNSQHIDSIMAGLDATVGEKGELTKTAESFRQLSDNLDKQLKTVAAGINRLTATGARRIDSLTSEGQRTLGTVNRAVRNLDSNPSRIITGGSASTVRQYNGR
ncbi:MAG TPA: MlaD family protein [Xanthobacteraceae bacterium]|jgi:phospholipid/cholesterol/gamma-HCH transport system substrate-binding protein|nr:MlaD family protein [Xanthobacteraceae bacterium]